MKFNSQICTTKIQSERLLALGLKKDTADMHHYQYVEGGRWNVEAHPSIAGYTSRLVPAWSLHRLLCLLPTEYIADIDFQHIMQDFIFRSQDMYDEAIGCIETLIKEGYFYKEYLEE
jgi:hypothetical protein